MANNISQTAWADHLRGCAGMANEIADILGLRDDAARQATFATVTIDAGKHGVFLEPIPEAAVVEPDHQAKSVLPPQRATPPRGEVVGKNLGALRDPTPEQAEGANRGALLAGINSARELLGWTPVALNEYIQSKLKVNKDLGSLDLEELAQLTEKLSKRIDVEKNKSESPLKEHLTNREKEKLHNTNEALEDWP